MSNTKGRQPKKKTTKQKPELDLIFEKMDLNHDGRISVTELVTAARQLGWNPTKAEAEQMIEDCNPSQKGYVNKKEFKKLFEDRQADLDKEKEEIAKAFRVFDKDNSVRDAVVGQDLHFMKSVEGPFSYDVGHISCFTNKAHVWFYLSLNNSGTITADEIKAVLRKAGEKIDDAEIENMIRTVDADGDGNISIEEFATVMCEYSG